MMTRNKIGWLGFGWAASLAAFAAACGGTDTCIAVQCTSGALMRIRLVPPPTGGSGPSISGGLAGSTVTACRNNECYSTTLPDVPAAGDTEANLPFGNTTFVLGSLWQNPDQSVDMGIEWHLASDQVVDGDHYVVTLNQGGVTTTLLDKLATYSAVAKAPEACGPGDCRIAELSP